MTTDPTIRALARGLHVLRLLQSGGAMPLAALHARSGLPKATLLRILHTLRAAGMVWQRMADDAWVPSFSLAELAGRMGREDALVESASPILSGLTQAVRWPSVLAVPRLTHMAVIETNASRAYFDQIALGPVGFQVNMLRSASGRAYVAFCETAERDSVLVALRASDRPGNRLARDSAAVDRIVAQVRQQGYALRDPDFGGDYDLGRAQSDDGRESLAVPIRLAEHVPGTINITWTRRAHSRNEGAALFAAPAREAAEAVARALEKRL